MLRDIIIAEEGYPATMTSGHSLLSRLWSKFRGSRAEQVRLLKRQNRLIKKLRDEISRLKEDIAFGQLGPSGESAISLTASRMETRGAARRQGKRQTNIRHFLDLEEGLATARLVLSEMPDLQPAENRLDLLAQMLPQIEIEGSVLEFGVYSGKTIRCIAEHHSGPIHGFDSFEGLPEAGGVTLRAGEFDLGGEAPPVPENVILHKGWFSDTLPAFLDANSDPVAFVHIDCDVYSSTKTVFDLLAPRLRPGSIIVFDEFFNFPGWRQHEFKAFKEACDAYRWMYEYLGRTDSRQVALKLTGIGPEEPEHAKRAPGNNQAAPDWD